MADSNITKRALAAAIKELMTEVPFDKINVSDICHRCNMNRKSFYYHFKDKYDLVNWIYDTEFFDISKQKEYASPWEFLADLCHYLETNRTFYRRAMKIEGQNSFSDHFTELLEPIIVEDLKIIFGTETSDFHIMFFSDAFVGAIKRWVLEMEAIDADTFISLLQSIILQTSKKVCFESGEIN